MLERLLTPSLLLNLSLAILLQTYLATLIPPLPLRN